jgi:hypothetical protein
MSSFDRVVGNTGAAATFSFTTSAGGALSADMAITISYPTSFFFGCPFDLVLFSGNISGYVSSCWFGSSSQHGFFSVGGISDGFVSHLFNVSFVVFGISMGLTSTGGSDFGFIGISTSADPIFVESRSGPILGRLSFPSIMLSQYLKNSATALKFEFTTLSSTAFKSVSVQPFQGFSASSLKVSCFMNKISAVEVLSSNYHGSVITVVLSSATRMNQNSIFHCTVSGLFTPKLAAVSQSVSFITFDSSIQPVDAAFSIDFPPIFDNIASQTPGFPPLTMSSTIRSTLLSEFLVSFTSSGAAPIALITVQGLQDFKTSHVLISSAQRCTHNNNAVVSAAFYTSPFLTIAINGSEIAYSRTAVVCSVKGLILPSDAQSERNDLVISSFGTNGAAVDTLADVSLPAIFAAEAKNVEISLSSYVSGVQNVVMTLSFVSPHTSSLPKGLIKTISVTGLFFDNFSSSDDVSCRHQYGMASGYATFVPVVFDPFLVITLAGTAGISSGPVPIICTVIGFTNSPSQRISSLSIGLTSWDAMKVPIDTATNIRFPNIFAFGASNGAILLSSQVVSKINVHLTLNFSAPYTGQSIRYITVSGVFFSPSLPDLSPTAQCYVDASSKAVQADSVVFKSAASELSLTFVSGQSTGLPVGTVGSFLAVTCKVTNLVNVPDTLTARSTVSFAVFGTNGAPLYVQSAIRFPNIVNQSLGLNRPRVSRFHLSFIDVDVFD